MNKKPNDAAECVYVCVHMWRRSLRSSHDLYICISHYYYLMKEMEVYDNRTEIFPLVDPRQRKYIFIDGPIELKEAHRS